MYKGNEVYQTWQFTDVGNIAYYFIYSYCIVFNGFECSKEIFIKVVVSMSSTLNLCEC